jgi:Mg-chelatase subunit ChlD/sugar lactone lactonase YvrE
MFAARCFQNRRHLARALALVLALFAGLSLGPSPTPALAFPSSQAGQVERLSYGLVDTLKDRPWQPEPGHFSSLDDVSSAPNGTTYVLDQGHGALHLFDPDGSPSRLIRDPRFSDSVALDIGPDGLLYLLRFETIAGKVRSFVDRLDVDGRPLVAFDVSPPGIEYSYSDLAIGPDGNIFLARLGQPQYPSCADVAPGFYPATYLAAGVDVFDSQARWLETFGEAELSRGQRIDVGPDGRVYVINDMSSSRNCRAAPVPTATARPSFASLAAQATPEASGRAPVQRMADRSGAVEGRSDAIVPGSKARSGIAQFDGEHQHLRTSGGASDLDVTAAAGGVFLAREVSGLPQAGLVQEILPNGQRGSEWPAGGRANAIDLGADGKVRAAIGSCLHQALFWIDPRRPSEARFIGQTDRPKLIGPVYPLGLAASDQLALLEGTHDSAGSTFPYGYERSQQAIQRWPLYDGAAMPVTALGQMGGCMGRDNHPENDFWYPVLDIAADGKDVYTLQPTRLERRPDDHLPDRIWDYKGQRDADGNLAHLSRVAARRGSLALLDVGRGLIEFWEQGGRDRYVWEYGADKLNGLPADIAISPRGPQGEGRVYLADRGRNRVLVHDPRTGSDREFSLHDGPVAIDTGPEGDLYVLGRGGWGLRYSAAGELVAWWRMPNLSAEFNDIAVDDQGRVYVSYTRLAESKAQITIARRILGSGVWVFEAKTESLWPKQVPAIGSCLAEGDKRAAPARLNLGESVEVQLNVQGECPGKTEPLQLAIAFDTSFSMSYQHSLERGQRAVLGILADFDPATTDLALITFGDGAALQRPLGGVFSDLVAPILEMQADGDTRMAAGIDIAVTELTGDRAKPDWRRVLLLVSDGVPKDAPFEAAEAAREAGIEVFGLILPYEPFGPDHEQDLLDIVGGRDHFLLDPEPDELSAFARSLTHYTPEPGLFTEIEIIDQVPDNMQYVEGSAFPPATWDPARRILSWRFADIPALVPLALRYRLTPLEVGTWPTNVEAQADFVDAMGQNGRLRFPVPLVEVVLPPPTPTATPGPSRIYLPIASKLACRPEVRPQDMVLVLDASSSMRDPAIGGGSKLDAVVRAASGFIDTLDLDLHRVGLVSFDERARRLLDLSHEQSELSAALQSIQIGSGTRIDRGLMEAHRMLLIGKRSGARPVVLLLSDGRQAGGSEDELQPRTDELKALGTTIFVVGLGSDLDHERLSAIASSPAHYYRSPDDTSLGSIYMQIALDIACRWP